MTKKRSIILLPLRFNNGDTISPKLLNQILRELDEEFDGCTQAGQVEGTYRMKDGKMAEDSLQQIWIVTEEDRISDLKKMVARFARMLKQESIYFETIDSKLDFIEPDSGNGGA